MTESTEEQTINDRVHIAVGKMTYKKLGQLTDTHPETVRRYMNGYAPSAKFLANIAQEFGVSGEWLLTGRGPMLIADFTKYVIENAEPQTLMNAATQHYLDSIQSASE